MALTPEQLYQRQQQYNQYGALATQGLGLFGQWLGRANQNNNINTTAPSSQVDALGKPIYNLGNFSQQVNSINTKGADAGDALSGLGQGAAIGAEVGGPAGAAIGGAIGGIGGLISGDLAGQEASRRKRIAQQSLLAAQRTYNAHISQYNNQLLGQQAYQDLQNPDARLYNVYKATTPYS